MLNTRSIGAWRHWFTREIYEAPPVNSLETRPPFESHTPQPFSIFAHEQILITRFRNRVIYSMVWFLIQPQSFSHCKTSQSRLGHGPPSFLPRTRTARADREEIWSLWSRWPEESFKLTPFGWDVSCLAGNPSLEESEDARRVFERKESDYGETERRVQR